MVTIHLAGNQHSTRMLWYCNSEGKTLQRATCSLLALWWLSGLVCWTLRRLMPNPEVQGLISLLDTLAITDEVGLLHLHNKPISR